MTWLLYPLAVAAGLAAPVQFAVNSQLRNYVGGPVAAAAISFLVGSIVLVDRGRPDDGADPLRPRCRRAVVGLDGRGSRRGVHRLLDRAHAATRRRTTVVLFIAGNLLGAISSTSSACSASPCTRWLAAHARGGARPRRRGARPALLMAELVLGPLLRHTGSARRRLGSTDAACEVEVLRSRSPTFCVHGHHYALVVVDGLDPGSATPYEVRSTAGAPGRPPTASSRPPCSARSPATRPGSPSRPAGSPRPLGAVHALPRRPRARPRRRRAPAYAHRMLGHEPGKWPHLLAFLGDQVYVERHGSRHARAIRAAGGTRAAHPGRRVLTFDEYALALPRDPGRPLTAGLLSDGLERDGLGRPRGARRLEHIGTRGVSRDAAGSPMVGGADRWPRSPPTGCTSTWATSRRSCSSRTSCCAASGPPTTDGRSCTSLRARPTARWRACSGA